MNAGDSARKLPWYAWVVLSIVGLFVLLFFGSPVRTHSDTGSVSRVVNNGKQLAICIKLHAGDAEGRHPDSLVELVNEGILDDQEQLDKLLAHPFGKPQKPLGWIYLPDLNDKSPPDYPLLLSPVLQTQSEPRSRILSFFMNPPPRFPTTPHRVVAFCDTSVEIMTEAKFQALLKKHAITLPASVTTNTAEK